MLKNWIYKESMPKKSNNSPNELGNRLANFRKAEGLTQAEVADALKIPQTTVSFYEREAPICPPMFKLHWCGCSGFPLKPFSKCPHRSNSL
jgi:DNA-binding XRE family transcriptional regulator